jgi:hypothetical protein
MRWKGPLGASFIWAIHWRRSSGAGRGSGWAEIDLARVAVAALWRGRLFPKTVAALPRPSRDAMNAVSKSRIIGN